MSRDHRIECPGCGSRDTDRAHVEFLPTEVEEIRLCNNCPIQFTNQFGDMLVEIDHPEEWQREDTDGFTPASNLDDTNDT